MLHDEATIKGNESIVKWHLNSLLVVFVLIFPVIINRPTNLDVLLRSRLWWLQFEWNYSLVIPKSSHFVLFNPSIFPLKAHFSSSDRRANTSYFRWSCRVFAISHEDDELYANILSEPAFQVVEASTKCVRRRSLKGAPKINLPLDSLVLYRSTYTRNMLKF